MSSNLLALDEVPERIGDLHHRLRREGLPGRLDRLGEGEDLEAVEWPRRDEEGVRHKPARAALGADAHSL